MPNNNIRVILDGGGKTVIMPVLPWKRPHLLSFLKNVYLKDLGLSNSELNLYLDDASNIILAKK